MKKNILLLFAALLPILVSCEKIIVVEKECEHEQKQELEEVSYTFYIDVKDKRIGQEKGSFKINVSSNHEWEAIVRKPSTDYISAF